MTGSSATRRRTEPGSGASAALGAMAHRVLLIDKHEECTSHDVVLQLRRFLGIKRIGHAGTLDPFATGLLLMLVGRATKLFPMLSALDKEYEGVLRLGVETSSGDPHGDVTRTESVAHVTEADVRRVAESLVGEQDQVPPMTSAVKHKGTPLYKLSRRGIEVERASRRIRVDAFEVLSHEPPDVRFRTSCSKGTYVRTLALEFGARLGVGAHLSGLRRTRIGSCTIEHAATLESLVQLSPREALARHGLSLSEALESFVALRLTPSGVRKVRCGGYPSPADMLDFNAVPEGEQLVQLLDPAGDLVAVGRSVDERNVESPGQRIELVRVI